MNVVERPAFSSPRSLLLQSAVRAASERAIGVDVFGLAPSGDSVRLFGQWQPNRSRGVLSASAPHFLELPGIVTAEAIWDEQSYRVPPTPLESAPVRERRKRASLSLAHWWAADTRAAVTVAADDWSGRGSYVSLSGDVDQRLLGDRVAVGGRAAGWWSGASAPFYAASARWSVRTRTTPERPRLRIDASYDFASARAPLALWSGAGTGTARPLLLRAHPLLRDGVIEGAAFGRELLAGSAQAETPIASLGPARLRAAVFVDAAKVLAPTARSHRRRHRRRPAAAASGLEIGAPAGRRHTLGEDSPPALRRLARRVAIGQRGAEFSAARVAARPSLPPRRLRARRPLG